MDVLMDGHYTGYIDSFIYRSSKNLSTDPSIYPFLPAQLLGAYIHPKMHFHTTVHIYMITL